MVNQQCIFWFKSSSLKSLLSPFVLCRTVVVENVVYRTVISAGGVFSPQSQVWMCYVEVCSISVDLLSQCRLQCNNEECSFRSKIALTPRLGINNLIIQNRQISIYYHTSSFIHFFILNYYFTMSVLFQTKRALFNITQQQRSLK